MQSSFVVLALGLWILACSGSAPDPAKGPWARTSRYGGGPQQLGHGVRKYGRVRQSRTALPRSSPDLAKGSWTRTSRHGDAEVQRNWLRKLRTEKGLAQAVNLAGPFIMSSQGKP
jgi:hypothetical protein